MSAIAVQAGTGRMVIDDDVEHARRSLAAIEETSKRALDEMRRLLGVLRAETTNAAALAPVPTLDDLDRLVAHAVEGGTPVDVSVDGGGGRAPAGVQLTAYRVVQEALTNVRRHAPGVSARVHVSLEAEDLVVEVENPLTDGADVGAGSDGGHGLLGMGERVSLYGGTFDAGPQEDGTFKVSARIPLPEPGRMTFASPSPTTSRWSSSGAIRAASSSTSPRTCRPRSTGRRSPRTSTEQGVSARPGGPRASRGARRPPLGDARQAWTPTRGRPTYPPRTCSVKGADDLQVHSRQECSTSAVRALRFPARQWLRR